MGELLYFREEAVRLQMEHPRTANSRPAEPALVITLPMIRVGTPYERRCKKSRPPAKRIPISMPFSDGREPA